MSDNTLSKNSRPLSLRVDEVLNAAYPDISEYRVLLQEQQAEIRRLHALLDGCVEQLFAKTKGGGNTERT